MPDQEHIFLPNSYTKDLPYTPISGGGRNIKFKSRNRAKHAEDLISKIDAISKENKNLQTQSIVSHDGLYLHFVSSEGFDLTTKSLENLRQGIRLLNIQKKQSSSGIITYATVYLPFEKVSFFLKKIKDFKDKNTSKGQPKNAALVNSIDDIQTALVEAFWTDDLNKLPINEPQWCEVWLRVVDSIKDSQVKSFTQILDNLNINYDDKVLFFPERVIIQVKANKKIFQNLIYNSDLLAEFRIVSELNSFWVNESRLGQIHWSDDLAQRINIIASPVKVCILDTGVNDGHPLLKDITKCDSVNPKWGNHDHQDHGTLMAGVAAYGDLKSALSHNQQVELTHKLISIKILPPKNQSNDDEKNWAMYTEQAIYRGRSDKDDRLIYCMAVTSDIGTNLGRPSSWSCSVDKVTYGEGNDQRLMIISGGNVNEPNQWKHYPNSNFTTSIQNPAQACNALVIGAFTEKISTPSDPEFRNFTPFAKPRTLSPFSTTSVIWERGTGKSKWPIKPDVVFEGGNLLKKVSTDDDLEIYSDGDLQVLSTSSKIQFKLFDTISATSAATAQAANLAAKISYKYPELWPEGIRGLMVHSANWAEEMFKQCGIKEIEKAKKSDIRTLLRVFGFGIPDEKKALSSRDNSFTFISQRTIQPFIKKVGDTKASTNTMHIYELPWPKQLLESLGDTSINLRVTLSYFIEPGPGELGWKDKYRYQSFGLRFHINNIDESKDQFIQRINKKEREEDFEKETNSGSNRWIIGTGSQDKGSIHSDIWKGTAIELANCNMIAVVPVIGWWRERVNLKKYNQKCRYVLLISLSTPDVNIDLITPVLHEIKVKTPTIIKVPTS